MDANDRRAIEDLFVKLDGVERNSPPRDREAEALIQSAIERFPSAPYYMAQTIIVQQQALEEAQRRLGEAEEGSNQGLFGGLFGGRSRQPARQVPRYDQRQQAGGPWGGGGFLAGAAQTAMGVAGGFLLGNLIAGAFAGGNDAQAADSSADNGRDDNDRDTSDNDSDLDNGGGSDFADAGGGDFGGDF
jgi:hypothetical protein